MIFPNWSIKGKVNFDKWRYNGVLFGKSTSSYELEKKELILSNINCELIRQPIKSEIALDLFNLNNITYELRKVECEKVNALQMLKVLSSQWNTLPLKGVLYLGLVTNKNTKEMQGHFRIEKGNIIGCSLLQDFSKWVNISSLEKVYFDSLGGYIIQKDDKLHIEQAIIKAHNGTWRFSGDIEENKQLNIKVSLQLSKKLSNKNNNTILLEKGWNENAIDVSGCYLLDFIIAGNWDSPIFKWNKGLIAQRNSKNKELGEIHNTYIERYQKDAGGIKSNLRLKTMTGK